MTKKRTEPTLSCRHETQGCARCDVSYPFLHLWQGSGRSLDPDATRTALRFNFSAREANNCLGPMSRSTNWPNVVLLNSSFAATFGWRTKFHFEARRQGRDFDHLNKSDSKSTSFHQHTTVCQFPQFPFRFVFSLNSVPHPREKLGCLGPACVRTS